MNKKLFYLFLAPGIALASQCSIVHQQCMDNAATKTIDGVTFNLSEVCGKLGLNGAACCWNNTSTYYCGDQTDTCGSYRKNINCTLTDNTCIDKDYVTGTCNKYQSKYSCAGGYQDVESKVCTSVICANNESGTAGKCYSPPQPNPGNVKDMGSVIAYLQMGQNMSQSMDCADNNHPENCTLFSGKYFQCYMYMFKADQPGSWNNNGADCGFQNEFFTKSGIATGYANSDRNLYSQATSGTNSVMGSTTSFGISNDDSTAINNSVKLQQQGNAPAVNQDQNINYTPNKSNNSKMSVKNGQVVSVTINKDLAQDVSGITAFKSYLTDKSVNLAWNRLKAEPDPNHVKTTRFSDIAVGRRSTGRAFGWNSGVSQPEINGLCIHLADSCEGGDDSGTVSDFIKAQLSWAGGFTNPNFCAACTVKDPILGKCLTGEPRNVVQQWCCFNSKIAMDINIAAYDQGLINFYTGNGSRYANQVNNGGGICGGVTVGMISKIDFSKADYFKDFMSSLNIDQLIDNTNFTNTSVQGNTSNRSNVDATGFVDEWKKKNGN